MRVEIADAVARFLLALDDRQWGRVEAALDGTVSRDYTSPVRRGARRHPELDPGCRVARVC